MGLLDSIDAGVNGAINNPLFNLGLGLMAGGTGLNNPGQSIQQAMGAYQQRMANQQKMALQKLNLAPMLARLNALHIDPRSLGIDLSSLGISSASMPRQGLISSPSPSAGLLQQTGAPAPASPGVTTSPLVSQQATTAPSPSLSWLRPFSEQDIESAPVNGLDPGYLRTNAMFSQDPTAQLAALRAQQLASLKTREAPILSRLDTLTKSDDPVKYMQADPNLAAAWPVLAHQLGIDPVSGLNAQNVRTAFTFERNALGAPLGEAAIAPNVPLQTKTDQYGRTVQVNGLTGQETVLPSPQLEKVVTADHPEGIDLPVSQAIGKQPYNQWAVTNAQMGGEVGALDAALTQAGVTIPGGGRGGQLYALKLKNLIAANPGVPPGQIAQMVKTGQLDFNGQKRSTGQLSQVLASTTAFSQQLEKNLDSLGTVEKAVDKTGVPILNKAFAAFQRNVSGGKDIAKYTAYFNAVTSEYAKIISGGTGVAAPNEQDMNEARRVITQAYTQGGLSGLKEALMTEANNKRASYQEGMDAARRTSTATSTPVPINTPNAPKTVNWADLK